MEALVALSEIFGVKVLTFNYSKGRPELQRLGPVAGCYIPPDTLDFEFTLEKDKWLTVDLEGLHLQSVSVGSCRGQAAYDLYRGRITSQIRKALGVENESCIKQ